MKSSDSSSQIFTKNNIWKLAACGAFLFIFGFIFGMGVHGNSSTKLQGSIFGIFNKASRSNASWSNASWSSTSWANASWSSASWLNASSSNADDNVLYLTAFKLGASETYAGSKVNVSIEKLGAYIKSASVIFEDSLTGSSFTSSINFKDYPYSIAIPKNAPSGNYRVTNLLLVGENSNGTTFTKQYSSNKSGANIIGFNFADTLVVRAQESTTTKTVVPIELKSISLLNQSVKVGNKVNVKYETSTKISSMKLILKQDSGKELSVNVQSLDNNPYFEVPSTTEAGTYKLVTAVMSNSDTTSTYSSINTSGATSYNFNSSIQVLDNSDSKSYVYNSGDITEIIIMKIYNSKSGSTIKVNASLNPIINSELFNSIKGQNKKLIINFDDNEMIFEGNDISDTKSIDVSVNSSNVSSDQKISSYVKDGILLDFASNGNLPGTAKVRIKVTDEMSERLNDTVYVYYFNPTTNKFEYVDKTSKDKSEEYYEFNISHTSQYILVNSKLDKGLVSTSTDRNDISHDNKLFFVLIGVGVIVILTVILLIIKEKNKKTSK